VNVLKQIFQVNVKETLISTAASRLAPLVFLTFPPVWNINGNMKRRDK